MDSRARNNRVEKRRLLNQILIRHAQMTERVEHCRASAETHAALNKLGARRCRFGQEKCIPTAGRDECIQVSR